MHGFSDGIGVLLLWTSALLCSYPPAHSNYDQIWDSAMRAAQDIGISITSSNKSTGTAFGQRDDVSVTIQVTPQSDGTTRVGMSAKGSQSATSAISDDFNKAYNHYMRR